MVKVLATSVVIEHSSNKAIDNSVNSNCNIKQTKKTRKLQK